PADHCREAIGCICPPLPALVSTTKPGRSSASLPRPYVIHEPMLGRPEIVVPVFMNVCAGSWLIASVFIDRITQMSSAMEPKCGNSEQISVPALPNRLNSCCGPKQLSFAPWSCAMGCPLVKLSGIG